MVFERRVLEKCPGILYVVRNNIKLNVSTVMCTAEISTYCQYYLSASYCKILAVYMLVPTYFIACIQTKNGQK